MRPVRAAVAIGAISLLLCPGGLQARKQGTLREEKQRLEKLQKEIAAERKKARETEAKEAAAQATLIKIKGDLEKNTQALETLETKLKSDERAIREKQREIGRAEEQTQEMTERWARRLRALYKQGQFGIYRLLFSADSLTDMAVRMKYLRTVTAHDRDLGERYATSLTALQEKQAALTARRAEHAKTRKRLEATQAAIADEKWRQRILLARLREEKEGYLTAIRELESAAGRLQELITRLSKQAKIRPKPAPILPPGPFTARKGKLPWPTKGTVAVPFGPQQNAKFNVVTFNKGIGIRAPLGEQIQVVYDGTILYADWFRGYGKLIIADHGQGFYSLYAHASELLVEVGDAVRAGQAIGRVGDTGSLEGPQLYFELRYEGEPQDPLAWLSTQP